MNHLSMLAEGLEGIRLNPHAALWLVLPLLPVAVAVIAVLYFQQRRLASRRVVLLLTAIRLILLLLIVGLFFRPAWTWVHTRTNSGTLWLLVDQSPSMQSLDRQATLAERTHWAEALGYLSASAREAKPDLVQAHFLALQSGYVRMRPGESEMTAGTAAEQRARAGALASRLAAWGKQAETLRKMADDDPAFKSPRGASVLDALERVSSSARNGAAAAKAAANLRDAEAAIPWPTLQTNMDIADRDLAALATAGDVDFARTHAGNSDVSAATARVTDVSRGDLAFAFLTAGQKRTDRSLQDLLGKYRVRIASFADTAETAGTVDAASFSDTLKSALNAGSAGTSSGQSTNIASALQKVGEQIGPDEPASIVIVSDGRHNTPGDPTEAARLLAARGVHVYGLLVGSHAVSADAAVDQIDSPEWVYKGDTLRAGAIVRFDGLSGKTARVELRRGEAVVDTQTIAISGDQMTRRVDFSDKPPEDATAVEYEVRVSELPGEVNLENNRSTFRIAVKKDKLYALVIEDRPRWEYRYLAAYLSRDPRLKLQTVLLNPAKVAGVASPMLKAAPGNPQIEAQLLPETRAEWQAFDFIILGDIRGDTLSPAQQQYIAAAVRDKGSTLIVIAGQRAMPGALANMPLAELLPVTLAPQWEDADIARHTRFGFRPGLAPEGNGSVLGQLAPDAEGNAALWTNVGLWFWHSPMTQAKPSASVIWSITEKAAAPGAAEPAEAGAGSIAEARKHALLATMSVGLGKSLYLASDQTWRLRQVNGSNVQDRFWGQVLRWAVGSDLPAGGKFVRFGSSQPQYTQGQPVVITARVLREDLTPYSGLSFSAIARPAKGGKAAGGAALSTEARFEESAETPGYYRATLAGLPSGEQEVSLLGSEVERLLDTDPSVTTKTLLLKILPQLDVEQRNMNTDPPLLARIADAGGGFSLDANYADVLAAHLPEIQRTETLREEVGFFTDAQAPGTRWAHWAFVGLFALLLTVEWAVRKAAGLV